MSGDPAALDAALAGGAAAEKPLIYAATAGELAGDGRAGQEARLPAGHPGRGRRPRRPRRRSPSRSRERRRGGPGARPRPRSLGGDLAAFTQLRRLALKKGARASATRIIAFCGARPRGEAELARATQAIAKYAGVVVLDHFDPAVVYALLTLRQNIYTDPQKPIQVEPKLYEIGAADRRQPACWSPPTSRSPTSLSRARSRAPACRRGCWSPTPTACRCSPPGRPASSTPRRSPRRSRTSGIESQHRATASS